MRKLLLAVLIGGVAAASLTACAGSTPKSTAPAPAGGNSAPGASSPRAAVDQFFAAVRAQDLQAMSIIWGTSKGPARDNIPRSELEKREIILQCYFNHDSFTVNGEGPGTGGQRVFQIELTRGNLKRATSAYTVQGPNGRWYVQELDMAAVRDFCTQQSSK